MKRNTFLIALAILCSATIWGTEPQKKKVEKKNPATRAGTTTTVVNGQTIVIWGQFADAATGGGGGGIGGAGGGGGGTAAGGGGGYGGGCGGVVSGGGGGLNVGNSSIAGGSGLGYGGIGGGGGALGNKGGNGAGTSGTISGGFFNGAGNGLGGGLSGASKGGNGFGGGGGTSVGGGGAGITQGGEGFGAFGATNAGAGGNLGVTAGNLSIGTGNTQSHSTDAIFVVNGGVLDIFGGSGGGGGNISFGSDATGINVSITSQTGGTINLLGGVGGGGGMLNTVKGGDGAGSIISSAIISSGAINVFGGAGGGGNSIGFLGSKGGNGTGGQLLGGSIANATLNVYGGANGQNASIGGFGTGSGGTGSGGYVSSFSLGNTSTMNMYSGSNISSPNTLPTFGGNGSTSNNITNGGGTLNLNGGTLQGTYNQSAGALNLNGGVNNATCTFSGGSVNNTTGTKSYTLNGANFTGGTVTTSSVGTDSLIFTNPTVSGSNLAVGNNVVLSGTTTISSGTVNLNPGSSMAGSYTQNGGTLNLNGGTNNATSTISGGAVNSSTNGATLDGAAITGSVTTDATPGSLLVTNPTVSSGGTLALGTNVTLEGSTGSTGSVKAMSRSMLRSLVVNGSDVTMDAGSSIQGTTAVNSGSLNMGVGSTLAYDLANYTGGVTSVGGTLNAVTGNTLNPNINLTSMKPGVFTLITGIPGTFTGLDLSSINVTYNGNPISTSGYTTAFSVSNDGSSLILNVGKAVSNCTITPISAQTYNGSAITPSIVIMDGNNTLAINSDYQLSYSNNLNAGVATITITGLGNYTGIATTTFNINKITISVIADPQTKTYGMPDPTLTYQIASGALAGNDVFTGTLTRDPGENAGNYTISIGTLSLPSNYTLSFTGNTFIIAKADQTITFDASQLNNKPFGTTPFIVNATASSGLPISFNSSDPAIASIHPSSGLVTILKPGAVMITASQAGNNNYNAAGNSINNLAIDSTFIGSTSLNISTIPDQIYTGSEIKPSITITDGGTTLVLDQDYTVSYVNNIVPGPAIITITGKGNYSGTINTPFMIKPINITVAADAKSKKYGTSDPSLTYQVISGALISGDAFTGTLIRDPGESVGTYNIKQGTLALSANYNLSFIENSLAITKANQTITFAATQLANKQFKDSTFTLVAIASSGLSTTFSSSDPSIASVNANGILNIKKAGTVTITASQDGDNNYNPAPDVSNSMTIMGKPISASDVVVVSISQQTFNGSPIKPVVTITDGTPSTFLRSASTLVENTDYRLSYSNNTSAGDATITIAGMGNYSGTSTINFTILPLPITVNAVVQTKTYGSTDPQFTYQVTAGTLIGGETFTGSLSREPGEDIGQYKILQGNLALSSNYVLSYIKNYLTITKADQTIEIDSIQLNNKKLGETPFPIIANTSSGLSITYSSSNTNVATVDENGIITIIAEGVTYITAHQAGNENYNAAQDVVVKLVIGNNTNATIELDGTSIMIYPNPVSANATIYVKANLHNGLANGAMIYLYDTSGRLISITNASERITELTAPSAAGMYIVKFKTKKDFIHNMKVIVK